MSFNDFVHEGNLKNKSLSNINIYGVRSSLSLSDVGIYFRDDSFSSDTEIVNLHPSKSTHWLGYLNENYFMFYG